jgi:hypothetical protein
MHKIAVRTSYLLLSSVLILSLAGCVAAPPPYEEFTLARAAIRAAQEVDSARFTAGLWNKADENFRNGQKAYKEGDFAPAKVYFKKTIEYAEKAENATRLKKFQSGDSFP